jgi:two-component system, NarL family, nitrate/nitrite response regulator NarL
MGVCTSGGAYIVVVSNKRLVREGIAMLLDHQQFRVGNCSTPFEALRIASQRHVDCALLDVQSRDTDVDSFFVGAKQLAEVTRVIICTDIAEDVIGTHLPKGTAVLPLASAGIDNLLETLCDLLSKPIAKLNGQTRQHQVDNNGSLRLTARQQRVIEFISDGYSTKEISARLGVSDSSVKCTIQQLFSKAGVRTRAQLVRVAILSGKAKEQI